MEPCHKHWAVACTVTRMYKYRMVIYWSESDQAFIAVVPELPSAMADGTTPQEAAANAQETTRLWIEYARAHGREIPMPQAEPASA